jgi:hypothetical protein
MKTEEKYLKESSISSAKNQINNLFENDKTRYLYNELYKLFDYNFRDIPEENKKEIEKYLQERAKIYCKDFLEKITDIIDDTLKE